ncbi:MAG: hypothetical protein J6B67_03700 [Oscillospiraceae bacterium]|nr:hypothetical protein [Oscillospiraceae bacterium]
MCRQNQLWGCVLIAFGVGVLVGTWLEGGFLCTCFALGVAVLGIGVMHK